ncbi:MAG: ABC transporter permease [Ilumatobacteraceae bacterium]
MSTPLTILRRSKLPAALVVPAVLAAVASLAPLAYLVDVAFDRGASYLWDELWQRRTLELVLRSAMLAGAVTLASVGISVPLAWAVVRSDLTGRRIWRVVLALPLAVPSYLAAFAWISWDSSLAGFWGALLVLTAVSYPYVYLPLTAAFSRLDEALDEIATVHGRGSTIRLMSLAAHQCRGTLAAGSLLVALYVLSDFGAVATMRYDAFTWVIYGAYRAGFNPTRAAVLALVLVIIALGLVAAEAAARGRAVTTMTSRAVGRHRPIRLRGNAVWFQLLAVLVTLVSLAFPVWRILVWVDNYGAEDGFGDVVSALWGSVRYSVVAAVVTVMVALPIALLVARYRTRTTLLLDRSTYVTHALPGIVVAISMVFIGVRVLRPVYLEAPLLVLAYVALFLPLAVGGIRPSAEQIPMGLDDVARSLGSSPMSVVRRINLPLIAPGLAAATALVTLAAMKELPVTMLLRPTGTETLATRLWTYTTVSDYAGAGPYALAIIVFVAIPTAIATGRR